MRACEGAVRAVVLGVLACSAIIGGACAPKGADDAAAQTTADSLAVADSTQRALAARADSILGRDSAFGPTHTIDAKGKETPIKRPPTP